MRIIVTIWLLGSFGFACQESPKFKEDTDNLILEIYNFEKFDLQSNTYYLDYGSLRDTIQNVLNKEEISKIIDSFNKNKIGEFDKDETFFTGYATMPPQNIKIRYLRNNIKLSSLLINDEFDGSGSPKNKKVRLFKDDILRVLNNNKKIMQIEQKIEEYNEQNYPNIPLLF